MPKAPQNVRGRNSIERKKRVVVFEEFSKAYVARFDVCVLVCLSIKVKVEVSIYTQSSSILDILSPRPGCRGLTFHFHLSA